MPSISDLQLEHIPIATAEFGHDPLPYFAAARSRHDWLAASDIGYVLTRYRAIDDIMRLDDKLKMPGEEILDIMGAHGTGWGDFCVEQMLVSSGERHARLRGSVSKAFGPGSVKGLRPLMRETVSGILDEWAPKGAFDFTDFAAQFPVRVMFALLGTSVERLPAIIKDHLLTKPSTIYLADSISVGIETDRFTIATRVNDAGSISKHIVFIGDCIAAFIRLRGNIPPGVI